MTVQVRSTTRQQRRRKSKLELGSKYIKHLGNGKFLVQVPQGVKDARGHQTYKRYGPFADFEEAVEKRDAHMRGLDAPNAEPVKLGRAERPMTLRDWSQHWLPVVMANANASSTVAKYTTSFEQWVLPYLGDVPLVKLRREDIETWRENLKKLGLGPDGINYALKRLKTCLNAAVVAKHISESPAGIGKASVEFVEVIRPERESNFADYPKLFAAAEGHYLAAVIQLVVDTGLRCSEVTALHWKDVEFDHVDPTTGKPAPRLVLRWHMVSDGSVKKGLHQDAIRPGSKTSKGKFYTVPLTQMAVAALKAHAKRLGEHKLASREWSRKAGKPAGGWFYGKGKNDRCGPSHKRYVVPSKPLAEDALVFPSADGTPLMTNNMYGWFKRVCARAGVDKSFHGMRHDCGSFMLARLVPLTVVSRILRHKSPAFTAEVYSHQINEQVRDGADAMDGLWASLGVQAQAV